MRQLTDGDREERKFKNARALCLQGNLSKAYRTIVQKGLAQDDKIQLLRDKHPSSAMYNLQDQEICGKFIHYRTQLIGKTFFPFALFIRW
jgi:hypothetical protein